MINSFLQKDKKCEVNLINLLEHLHVTIQELPINDPKPSTSGQITKPNTSNNSRFKNINPYQIKRNNISTTSPFSGRSFKKCLNADIDVLISTINSNINILYRFRKSSAMEHYYDEPTHVRSYKKKICTLTSEIVRTVLVIAIENHC